MRQDKNSDRTDRKPPEEINATDMDNVENFGDVKRRSTFGGGDLRVGTPGNDPSTGSHSGNSIDTGPLEKK